MRIERIRVEHFGGLRGFDSGADPLPGLVVVLGPNEAGKSTLFHFLATMLYGFHPASREGHPYAPWSGEDASGSLRLRLDDEACAEIARQLKSQPQGRMTADGTAHDLRNQALPWVRHVPRTVFSQVFAITLNELAALDPETWAGIQDRLMGAMGATDLLPARGVADELEQEAGRLWRPHRRGNQRVRDLQDEILKLRARRRHAQDRDRDLRRVVEDLERTRSELTEARTEHARKAVALERVQELAPLRDQLLRIEALRAEGGDRVRLQDLPGKPGDRATTLEERVEELERRLADLARREEAPLTALARFGERAQSLVERARAIRELARRLDLGETALAARLRADVADLDDRLAEACAGVLAVPWSDAPAGPLAALRVSELRAAVHEAESAREDRRILEAASPARAPSATLGPVVAAAAAGALGLTAGIALGNQVLLVLGAAAAAVGATAFALRPRTPVPGSASIERVSARERAAAQRVRELLRDLPVESPLLDSPRTDLVDTLAAVMALVRERDRRSNELARCETAARQLAREAASLASAVGSSTATAESPELALDAPFAIVGRLRDELTAAERAQESASGAEDEVRRIESERREVAEALSDARSELDALREGLRALAGGDLAAGLAAARAALAAHERADRLEEELAHVHGGLDEVRERIADAEASSGSWTTSDTDLAALRAEVERLNELVVERSSRAEALERDIAHLSESETVDSVDGEIEALSQEARRLIRERDRLWVLAQLVRETDRRFREEHQPDVIRRAGAYLDHLTGGRYQRILVDETQGDLFHLDGPGLERPVPLTPPISTGALEQAYLALRLAIIDHLDQGGERLPLFIDEAFVNWDPSRRDRGMEVMTAISRGRQAFVFTCHPPMADALRTAGAHVLDVGEE